MDLGITNIGNQLPKLNVVKTIQMLVPVMSKALSKVIPRLAQIRGGVFVLPNIDNFQKDIRIAIENEFGKFKAAEKGTEIANQKAKEVTTSVTTTQPTTQVTTQTETQTETQTITEETKKTEPEQKKNGDGLNKVPWIPIGIGGGLFDLIRNLGSNPISLIALGVGGYLILSQNKTRKK